MNYQLSNNPETRKILRNKILASVEITLEEITKYLEKRNISPSWRTTLEAVNTMLDNPAVCKLCGAPTIMKRRGRYSYRVCSLYPVHSFIKDDKQLGSKCEHDIYLVECEVCLTKDQAQNIEHHYHMADWWTEHDITKVVWRA